MNKGKLSWKNYQKGALKMPRQKKNNETTEVESLNPRITQEPVITSITLTRMGSILGLADNKIYRYDDLTKKWVQR